MSPYRMLFANAAVAALVQGPWPPSAVWGRIRRLLRDQLHYFMLSDGGFSYMESKHLKGIDSWLLVSKWLENFGKPQIVTP